ncbi:MAG: nucleotidyltransferase domain-containing protein [Solirubrobacteraceae bacterium]
MGTESDQLDLRRLRVRRDEILGYATQHGARNVRVFGSIASGERGAASDVDLVVEMEPGRSRHPRARHGGALAADRRYA